MLHLHPGCGALKECDELLIGGGWYRTFLIDRLRHQVHRFIQRSGRAAQSELNCADAHFGDIRSRQAAPLRAIRAHQFLVVFANNQLALAAGLWWIYTCMYVCLDARRQQTGRAERIQFMDTN